MGSNGPFKCSLCYCHIDLYYSKRKEIMRLYNDFWDRFIPALKRGEHPEKVSFETVEEKGDVL